MFESGKGTYMTQAPTTAPLGGLPAAKRVLLDGAQIELAALEIRYAGEIDSLDVTLGLALKERLAPKLDLFRLQPAEEHQWQIEVGTSGPGPGSFETRTRGWQLFAPDNALSVSIFPDKLVIQTPKYARWSQSLQAPLSIILEAITEVIHPDLTQRVGLRYINRLVDPEARRPADWMGRIESSVLGPVVHDTLGGLVSGIQQQIELTLGREQGALLRHGAFRDIAIQGAYSYLLDIDVYDVSTVKFEAESISSIATVLNRTAFSLFQQMITTEYLESMNPSVIDDSQPED
jgi:uncharacterized protein (TIGR04255 family)